MKSTSAKGSPMDVFQFYASSADAAPGKGTGETLSSPPDTYAALRKIPNWRRTLAEAHTKGGDAAKELPLTQSAQLWYAPPRKPKERAAALESAREALRPVVQEAEMEAKPKKTRAKKGGADTPTPEPAAEPAPNVSTIPEGALAGELVVEEPGIPDMEASEKTLTIRFCPVCNYKLYLQVSEEDSTLSRHCKCCGFSEKDEKGGLVMEMMVQTRSDEAFKILLNEFTWKDSRLPHIRGSMKCPQPTCDSNHGKATSDIMYIKYDAVNMLYLYHCSICEFNWTSSR